VKSSNCGKKILVSLSVSSFVLPLGFCLAPTHAQPSMYTGGGGAAKLVKDMPPAPRVPSRASAKANELFSKMTVLPADKVTFDDIPKYPGKEKYTSGARYEHNDGKGSNMALVTYVTTEPKDQVKDWYAQALRMYGWDITFQSPTVINAHNNKSGNSCNMQFYDCVAPGSRSSYQIDYHHNGK
jgi:hypothetical protein